MKLGRQILDKVALLALLFGVAFFLKYAFDRGWISDYVKILGGTALGYALLTWSEVLFGKAMRRYAAVIAASGFGVLFLTVYAGMYLYQIFSAHLAFAYLLVGTLALVLQAVRHDSEILAVWSLVGAGFAPQMLAGFQLESLLTSRAPGALLTADYQPFTLQGPYLVAINLAYSWIIFRKHWPLARLALLMANVITVLNWNVDLAYSRPVAILLWILAAMFVAPSLKSESAGEPPSPASQQSVFRRSSLPGVINVLTTVAAVLFFYSRLLYVNSRVQTTEDYWITLGFAVLAAAAAVAHRILSNRGEVAALVSFSVLFLYIFCAQAWEGWKLVLAWLVLAGAMNWVAANRLRKDASKVTLVAAWIVFISALLHSMIYAMPWTAARKLAEIGLFRVLLWNEKAAALAMVTCGGAFWAAWFKKMALSCEDSLFVGSKSAASSAELKSPEAPAGVSRPAKQLSFIYVAPTAFLGWYWISHIVGEYFRYRAHYFFSMATFATVELSTSVAWTLYAAALFAISLLRKNAALRKLSMLILVVTILKVFLYDVSNLETVYRFISFLVLSAVLYGVSYVYNRYGKSLGF